MRREEGRADNRVRSGMRGEVLARLEVARGRREGPRAAAPDPEACVGVARARPYATGWVGGWTRLCAPRGLTTSQPAGPGTLRALGGEYGMAATLIPRAERSCAERPPPPRTTGGGRRRLARTAQRLPTAQYCASRCACVRACAARLLRADATVVLARACAPSVQACSSRPSNDHIYLSGDGRGRAASSGRRGLNASEDGAAARRGACRGRQRGRCRSGGITPGDGRPCCAPRGGRRRECGQP